jgi:CubicO group peptidase (beta-lactamase class C family)
MMHFGQLREVFEEAAREYRGPGAQLEPVAEYLPELGRLSPEVATRLTARHLLSHTGGLTAECAGLAAGRSGWSRWLRNVQPPGTGFSYSNRGHALIRRIVEVFARRQDRARKVA